MEAVSLFTCTNTFLRIHMKTYKYLIKSKIGNSVDHNISNCKISLHHLANSFLFSPVDFFLKKGTIQPKEDKSITRACGPRRPAGCQVRVK